MAVTIVHLAEAERTWVIMQDETPQAGNRARKSFRRHQWSDHAGELELGSPRHLYASNWHANIFAFWDMAHMKVRVLQNVAATEKYLAKKNILVSI